MPPDSNPAMLSQAVVQFGGCGQYPFVAFLVKQTISASSELLIASIQIKHDGSSAQAQLHPLRVLFPGSGCGCCLCVQQAALRSLPALPSSSLLCLFSPTLCNPDILLFGDDRVPLLIEEGSRLPVPEDSLIYEKYTYCTQNRFSLNSVVLIHNSLCGEYFLCKFGNFSQRLTLLPYYCPCCSKGY